MNEIPCEKLMPEKGPVCWLGKNTVLCCTSCSSYDWHPKPTELHYRVWNELRFGAATSKGTQSNAAAGEWG